ncbi:MAG TPA: S41 family peptidase [Anaerolineales bacterium]
MRTRRISIAVLLVFSLACNFVTGRFNPPAPTPALLHTPAGFSPAYVPPGCEGAALATVPAATQLAVPTPELQANPEISKEIQLRVFDTTVDTIDKVYVYPDFNGVDWPAVVAKHRSAVQAGLSTEAFYEEMQALVDELGDDHSHFESPVEVAESDAELAGSSEFVGIGVSVMPQIEKNRATILAVYPDSPAEHGGLMPHDTILAADGLPVVENGQAFIQRVRGPECSAVNMTVQSPGKAPRDVLLIRHRISGGTPVDARLVPTADGSRVGYIMLPTFFDQTVPEKVRRALEAFGDLDGLILDNRLNGGGSSTVVEPILAFFTSGKLGSFKSRAGSRPLNIEADPIHNSQSVPLVVLVGPETVSYGEIFSGALKDVGRALIVGQTTLGNVETLHGYDFEDDSRLWIAEETFDPVVSHADWEAIGIVPDVEAYADWDTFTFETDPSVAAALTLLGHQ